ncbi:hypothetical protein LUZ60_007501 [Juncus effusus]|nr:hypothetical protein LUZ60_007501 [Juncus effusus]
MDRYRRVEKPREETPISENEIRITAQGRMRNYISYALTLLQEKGSNEIVLKAMGRAINKTVMIVELVKRRVVGLHQITKTESIDITDVWEPLEEGLLPLETIRHVSMISVTLSKTELDTSAPGYQPPLPEDQVRTLADFENDEESAPTGRGRGRRGGGRGRGRGMTNNGMQQQAYNNDNDGGNFESGYGGGYGGRRGGGYRGGYRGGRGGYRGGRGRGRYYNNNNYNNDGGSYGVRGGGGGGEYDGGHYDDGEVDERPPPQFEGARGGGGRGRGRGMGRGRGRGRAPPPPPPQA